MSRDHSTLFFGRDAVNKFSSLSKLCKVYKTLMTEMLQKLFLKETWADRPLSFFKDIFSA